MTREESMELSALVGRIVAEKNPVIAYTDEEVAAEARAFGEEERAEMAALGLYHGDFEEFYVVREFLSRLSLPDESGEYLAALFARARRLDADAFLRDPYLATVEVPTVVYGDFLLTTASYARGEIFFYDMPDLGPIVVPKLGFFNREVRFPALYEKNIPWISVCPSEIRSMAEAIGAAHGRVLVLGLGLGYYPFRIASRADVAEITIVELQPRVVSLFTSYLLPQFPGREKIRVVTGDAIAYLAGIKDGDYDFCFADIWEGVADGAPLYTRIRALESRLPHTEFSYWIGREIDACLAEGKN